MNATEATIRRVRAIAAWLRQMPEELGDRDADAMAETIGETIFSLVERTEDDGMLAACADAVEAHYDAMEQNADGTWPETFTTMDDEFWDAVEAEYARRTGVSLSPPVTTTQTAVQLAVATLGWWEQRPEWVDGWDSVDPLQDAVDSLTESALEQAGIWPNEDATSADVLALLRKAATE